MKLTGEMPTGYLFKGVLKTLSFITLRQHLHRYYPSSFACNITLLKIPMSSHVIKLHSVKGREEKKRLNQNSWSH